MVNTVSTITSFYVVYKGEVEKTHIKNICQEYNNNRDKIPIEIESTYFVSISENGTQIPNSGQYKLQIKVPDEHIDHFKNYMLDQNIDIVQVCLPIYEN
jgi:hypothetical protein